jgi:PKD repeat protein
VLRAACSRLLVPLVTLAIPLLLATPRPALGAQVVTVAVTPGVVPVGATPATKSSLLVTASVSAVPPGSTATCTVAITLQPSGTLLGAKTIGTSPAPASGVTSVSTLFTINGGIPAGAAQATVTCGTASGATAFRISSFVALIASPLSVPAGGVLAVNLLIATNGPLPLPAQCTLAVTDPAGTTPPLAFQLLAVSGGSLTAPAAATTTIPLPAVAPLGTANASASCVIQGVGTAGDSADFSVTDPSQVSLVSPPTTVAAGGTLALNAVTLPGFACTAQLTPPGGQRIDSAQVTAGPTGLVSLMLQVPVSTQPGTASLLVVCTDPSNPANSATSAPLALAITATATVSALLPLSAALIRTPQPLPAGGLASIALTTVPAAACSIRAVLDSAGNNQPLSEPGASGSAAIDGTLTLSFHLPASEPAGTSVAEVSCVAATGAGSTQVAVQVGAGSACGALDPATDGASTAAAPAASAGGPYSGAAGSSIQFSGGASQPSSGAGLTSCLWSFGDGQTATGLTPTHAYDAAGTYPVTLSIADSAGFTASSSTTATVSGFVPLCADPAGGGNGGLTACVAAATCPSSSLPGQCLSVCASYSVAVLSGGSGCPQPSTSVQASAGGPYRAQVFQPVQLRGTASASGTRRLCAPDATLGAAGPVCQLVPAVSLPQPEVYTWDFGDGTGASGAGTAHAYATAGSFTVTLTVSFDDGSTATATTRAEIAGIAADRRLALAPGCTEVQAALSGTVQPPVLAGWVTGGRVTAIWAMLPGQASAGWFPDAGAPGNLAVIGTGEGVSICVDGFATLVLPA